MTARILPNAQFSTSQLAYARIKRTLILELRTANIPTHNVMAVNAYIRVLNVTHIYTRVFNAARIYTRVFYAAKIHFCVKHTHK